MMIVDEMNEALEATIISHYGNTFGQKYFMTKGKQTTNLASINKTMLSALPIPLSSIEEQQIIVQEIDSRLSVAEKIELAVDANLQRAEHLRQSILKQAFSGKLV